MAHGVAGRVGGGIAELARANVTVVASIGAAALAVATRYCRQLEAGGQVHPRL